MSAIRKLGVCVGLVGLGCGAAWAQTYPAKPVRVVIVFPPGGATDIVGRIAYQKVGEQLNQQFIIDNRPGAGGTIGASFVAKSPPDGYTVLHTSSAHALLPAFNKLPYDPVRDFTPITPAVRTIGYVLGVHPSVPARTVQDLIGLAKRNPGKLNYGNSGFGGVLHVATEMFNSAAGITMTTVQYKGIGNLVNDLAGGHIDLSFLTTSNALGMAKTGKVRAIGISGKNRWKQLPDVPTLQEAGLKDFEYYAWFAFWFPAGAPTDIVGKFHGELAKAAVAPEVMQRWDENGFEPFILKPDEFGKLVQSDIDATRKLAARLGVKP